MNVVAPHLKVISAANAMIRESPLPHRKLGAYPVRKTSLDKPHRALNRDALRSQQKMDVIWHDDKSVQFVVGPVCGSVAVFPKRVPHLLQPEISGGG